MSLNVDPIIILTPHTRERGEGRRESGEAIDEMNFTFPSHFSILLS